MEIGPAIRIGTRPFARSWIDVDEAIAIDFPGLFLEILGEFLDGIEEEGLGFLKGVFLFGFSELEEPIVAAEFL